MHPAPSPPPSRARTAALVAGSLVGLVALFLLLGGGVALWADGEKDEHGYLTTSAERFATDTRALATEKLDFDVDGLDDVLGRDALGKLRLEVAGAGDEPVFAGVARTRDVTRYLRGAAHTTVADVEVAPFEVDYRDHAGDRRPGLPATQRFWAASTQGPGTRTLTWDIQEGDWSVVVMNADASAGVDARVSAGANLPFADDAGWILTGSGLLAAIAAVGLLVAGARPRQRRPDEPNPSAPRSVSPSASTT